MEGKGKQAEGASYSCMACADDFKAINLCGLTPILRTGGKWPRLVQKKEDRMTGMEKGSGNVYADLGLAGADEMLLKAQLAMRIGEIIKLRGWTLQEAAGMLHMTAPELSKMLRGQFRDISPVAMRAFLVRHGCGDRSDQQPGQQVSDAVPSSLKDLLFADSPRADFDLPRRGARARRLD